MFFVGSLLFLFLFYGDWRNKMLIYKGFLVLFFLKGLINLYYCAPISKSLELREDFDGFATEKEKEKEKNGTDTEGVRPIFLKTY
jgi:hypothetical protein